MLQLGMSPANYRRPTGGGGGAAPPASTTRFWGPQDMTFNGSGELTAITDQIADSSYIGIIGAPTGDVSAGIQMTEADASANHIRIESGFFPTSPGTHMALLVRRNATFDDDVMILSRLSSPSSNYIWAGDGDSNTGVLQNFSYTAVRSEGSESVPATRNDLWDIAFNDSAWRVIMFEDVRLNVTDAVRFLVGAVSWLNWEGDFAGFGEFTDWAEADDMEAALLASVA